MTTIARVMGVGVALALASGAGCSDDSPSGGGGAGAGGAASGGGGAAAEDPGDLYDPTRVVEIAIEMDPADAATMAQQTRVLIDLLSGETCLAEPFPSPYTFFHADVTIDGFTKKDVGVRKKGFVGSLSTTKPSLKLDLAEFVPGQQLGPYERFTLNNSNQDPSLIRTCMTYGIFAGLGLPAPRCNFAHVTLNGEDLGVYANVEPINADFVDAHFEDAGGDLYEGTLSDFRDGFTGTFEKETNQDDPSHAEVDALTAALAEPDAALFGAVEPLVSLDEFYTYWAAEALTNHWDGYANNTNNFYGYFDPQAGLRFVVSGPDGALTPDVAFQAGPGAPSSVFATGQLARRLYLHPQGRAAYLARLHELLDTRWDEAALLAEVDRMEQLLAPFDPDTQAIAGVRSFIDGRRAALEAELAAGDPAWPYPPRDPFCLADLGTIDATFSTTWGTIGQNPFVEGSGTLDLVLGGTPEVVTTVGALAGHDPGSPPGVLTVQHAALRSDGLIDVVVISTDAGVPANTPVRFDLFGATATLVLFDPTNMTFTVVGIVDGAVTFSQIGTQAGAPIVGTLSGKVIEALGN